jgi:tetratricopeptide (TPR) repeat protein
LTTDREATLKNAEKFLRVGRLDAAIVEYARVVDDHPRDWNSANTLGDLYLRAGQPARAVPLYKGVADHLLAEGFYPKAAALFRKILKITPADEDTQLRLAEISVRQGLLADARSYYGAIEKRRRQAGDAAGADEIIIRLGALDSEDLDARMQAARALERSGRSAEAARHYRELYDAFLESGNEESAISALRDCARCDATQRAASLLPLARIELRAGRFDEARSLLGELLATDAESGDAVVDLAREFASDPAAEKCGEVLADVLVAAGDFSRAVHALQQLAVPGAPRVGTLLKLVEVCVDGGLEELMFDAQAQLTDAYLTVGRASEARLIAEDLLERDADNPAHIERLRRALRALNVDDVDASIAERIPMAEAEEAVIDVTATIVPTSSTPLVEPEIPDLAAPADEPVPTMDAVRKTDSVEIDLTELLGELQGQAPPPEAPARPPQDLDRVFAELRSEVDASDAVDAAHDHFDLAKTYLDMGMRDEAVAALQVAARSPRIRFEASRMAAELYRDEGDLRAAIEWFERAGEVPAPSAERGRALLYDLGDLLETLGETARALAVFLEVNADAPNYRDVKERVARLSRVETEG